VLSSFPTYINAFPSNVNYSSELKQLQGQINWCIKKYEEIKKDFVEDSDDESAMTNTELENEISEVFAHIISFLDSFYDIIPEPKLVTIYRKESQNNKEKSKEKVATPSRSVTKKPSSSSEGAAPSQTQAGLEENTARDTMQKRKQDESQSESADESRQTPKKNTEAASKKTPDGGIGSAKKPTNTEESSKDTRGDGLSKKRKRSEGVVRFLAQELEDEAQLMGVDNNRWKAITKQTDPEICSFIKKHHGKKNASVREEEEVEVERNPKRRYIDKHTSARSLQFLELDKEGAAQERAEQKKKATVERNEEIEQFSEEEQEQEKPVKPSKPKKQGTKKTPWTDVEVKHLLAGMKKYGVGM
jgi:hypothetical protein